MNGYSLWLLPGPEDHEYFSRHIQQLATRLQAPVFQPHLTLVGASAGPGNRHRANSLLRLLPLALKVKQVQAGDAFFQALFVTIETSPGLAGLFKEACHLFKAKESQFNPHVSLYYGLKGQKAHEHLPALAINEVTFDRLAWVKTSDPVEDWVVKEVIAR